MASHSGDKVSFIAKVELIKLRQQHSWMQTATGWTPPDSAEAFTRGGQKRLFRWHDGTMQRFNEQCPGDNQAYSAATIFSEGQSNALLAVLCDAQSTDALDAWGWKSLKFEAAEPQAAPKLSRVGPDLKYEKLRAAEGQAWVGQLLPTCYHNTTSGPTMSGLVGRLPILIALAALSTSASKINTVLPWSIRGHKWIRHSDEQGRLRNSKEEGIVVTIYYDPKNSTDSTKNRLERLERGEYGAFYQA